MKIGYVATIFAKPGKFLLGGFNKITSPIVKNKQIAFKLGKTLIEGQIKSDVQEYMLLKEVNLKSSKLK